MKLGVESKDGILLTENEEVKNRWKEYFRELFNGEEREIGTRREYEESEEEMPDDIREDEVRRSIWKLKSGKSSGVCGIQGELLKAGGYTVKWLQEIYSMVWRTGVVPRDMPSAGSTICRRHSLDHRKGGGPARQHQGTANSSEGKQAGSKLDKNQHNGNWQRMNWM